MSEPSGSRAKSDITAGVTSFITQQIIATVGAMVMGITAVVIPSLLIALFVHTSKGSVIDSIVKIGADNPYFVGPIVTGFVFGWISHRFFGSRVAASVWVLPTLILVWNVMTWRAYGPLPHWANVQANFFTSNCGDSDCLYELIVTGPFYTSVAYTLGWAVRSIAQRRALPDNLESER